ncbi:MAG: glycerophosphodiester phosphodiesterase family protein [Candidatus Woesebacteria bacterium]
MMSSRPLIIAHRGASQDAQENTVESILLAAVQGADMVEMDLRITKDQILVLNHNDRLKTFRPTIKISQYTYDELVAKGFTLPKLTEIIDQLPPRVLINLDLKDTTMDLALARVLSHKRIEQRIIFDSNNLGLLNRYSIHFPNSLQSYSTGTTYNPFNILNTFLGRVGLFLLTSLLSYPARFLAKRRVNRLLPEYVSLHARFCLPQDVEFYHSLGVKVFVFVVNKEENMRKFIAMKVDGIKTDNPILLASILKTT